VPQLALREHRPTDPRWRGDLLAPSSHGRLVPEAVPAHEPATAASPSPAAAPGPRP